MEMVKTNNAQLVLQSLIAAIHTNAAYLSQVDGAIGDGDHGINMDKGFQQAGALLAAREYDLSTGLETLGTVLMDEIGGAMGPIYGTFFLEMAEVCRGHEMMNKELFARMLGAAVEGIQSLGGAKVGDKTLMDTLIPANQAFSEAICAGGAFSEALVQMKAAAEAGKESTRGLVAKIGRASRLGERSRGVLDAGATSCCILLHALADSLIQLIPSEGGTHVA